MQAPDDFDPPIGIAETLEPGLRRIVAPNPSPMTYRGTNTYLVGHQELCVIDPGPTSPAHLEAIKAAIGPDTHLKCIIVTHSHIDHSPLARPLAQSYDHKIPIYAYGSAEAGRSVAMQQLLASGMSGGGEGIDADFSPDISIDESDEIVVDDMHLEVLHTPGHIGNHICLAWGDRCFTADHVMGWASSLVSPPDGDLTDFMASCHKLAARDWRVFYPGHGAPIEAPQGRLSWLIAHRQSREADIRETLGEGPATATALARKIYTDTPAALLGAAARNVLAHLIDLVGKDQVTFVPPLREETTFALKSS